MNYQYELNSGYYSHIKVLRKLGASAQLYDSHDTVSIINGKKIITFWKPGKKHEKVKEETLRLGELFAKESGKPEEFTPEKLTPGRLIRGFLKHIIQLKLEDKAKIYGDRYYYLAVQRQELLAEGALEEVEYLDQEYSFTELGLGVESNHWHYLYLSPEPKGYAIELDLTAAYMTSLLQEKTFFWYDPGKGGGNCFWLPDGGALARLREWIPELPKWFRLQMLGIMGSHERKYSTVDLKGEIIQKVDRGGIKYGAAFNTVHKAIYRVYATMSAIADQVKDDLIRCHTDSFTLRTSMTRRAEAEILSTLAQKGFQCSCKGIGWAQFLDINTGLMGMGEPKNVTRVEEAVKEGIIRPMYMPIEHYDRWAHWLPPMPEWIKQSGSELVDFVPCKSVLKKSPEQLQGYWRVKVNDEWLSRFVDAKSF